jgi:hypothetical protein
MKTFIKAGIIAVTLATGLSSAMAAPRMHVEHNDPWFQQLHLESSAVPAQEYFQQMERDGD